ncbi:MAG TPA: hypothetical protein VLK89_07210 [Solirubrobacterales bacterium]|nr:hypothetical protein [Solirubrobacterales bacterium]
MLQQLPHPLDHGPRLTIDAEAGDPDHLDTDQLQLLLSEAIALKGFTRAVARIDVKFDDEALALPVGVQLVPGDVETCRGQRQASLT